MNRKIILKIIIDVCMTVCLLFLMPYSLLGETLHEWLGIVMFVLFVTHHVLNRKWMAAVTKGKYTPFRIVQTLIVFVMLVLMLGSMVSGVLLSNHIFRAVRIAGISMAARQVHMFCAYFGMVVMSVHLGLHWNMVVNMTGNFFVSICQTDMDRKSHRNFTGRIRCICRAQKTNRRVFIDENAFCVL